MNIVSSGKKAGLKTKLYKEHDLRVRINQKHLTKIISDLENHFKDDIDMALTLESINL